MALNSLFYFPSVPLAHTRSQDVCGRHQLGLRNKVGTSPAWAARRGGGRLLRPQAAAGRRETPPWRPRGTAPGAEPRAGWHHGDRPPAEAQPRRAGGFRGRRCRGAALFRSAPPRGPDAAGHAGAQAVPAATAALQWRRPQPGWRGSPAASPSAPATGCTGERPRRARSRRPGTRGHPRGGRGSPAVPPPPGPGSRPSRWKGTKASQSCGAFALAHCK